MPTPGQGIVQGGVCRVLGVAGEKRAPASQLDFMSSKKRGRGRQWRPRKQKMVDPNPADSILQVRLQGTAQPRSGVAVPLDPCPCRGGHGGNSGAVVDVCHLATTTLLQRNGSPSFSGVWDPTSRKSPNIPTLRRTLPPKRRDDPPWTAAPLHAPPLHEPSQP